jgi:hypothetical protein
MDAVRQKAMHALVDCSFYSRFAHVLDPCIAIEEVVKMNVRRALPVYWRWQSPLC